MSGDNGPQPSQADRERAWDFRPSCYKDNPETRTRWMEGVYDAAAPCIRAFAIHRTNAVAALAATLRPFVNVRDQFPQTVKLINPKLSAMEPVIITVTKGQFLAAVKAIGAIEPDQTPCTPADTKGMKDG